MKLTVMTVALLIAVASGSAWAQSGSKQPDRRPTPTAGGIPSSSAGQNSQTSTSGQKSGSEIGTGSTGSARSQSGSGSKGGQTNGIRSRQHKSGTVNQGAAGVPTSGSASSRSANKPNNNQ